MLPGPLWQLQGFKSVPESREGEPSGLGFQTTPALSGSGAHGLETTGHLTHPLGFHSTLTNPPAAHTLDFPVSQSLYQEHASWWLTESAGPGQATEPPT